MQRFPLGGRENEFSVLPIHDICSCRSHLHRRNLPILYALRWSPLQNAGVYGSGESTSITSRTSSHIWAESGLVYFWWREGPQTIFTDSWKVNTAWDNIFLNKSKSISFYYYQLAPYYIIFWWYTFSNGTCVSYWVTENVARYLQIFRHIVDIWTKWGIGNIHKVQVSRKLFYGGKSYKSNYFKIFV